MVHGSWLKGAQPGPRGRRGRGVGGEGGGPTALAGLPWAMSHEPLTINARLIKWIIRLCITSIRYSKVSKFQIFKVSSFQDSKIPGFQDSKFQNLKVPSFHSEFKNAKIWKSMFRIPNISRIWEHLISNKVELWHLKISQNTISQKKSLDAYWLNSNNLIYSKSRAMGSRVSQNQKIPKLPQMSF